MQAFARIHEPDGNHENIMKCILSLWRARAAESMASLSCGKLAPRIRWSLPRDTSSKRIDTASETSCILLQCPCELCEAYCDGALQVNELRHLYSEVDGAFVVSLPHGEARQNPNIGGNTNACLKTVAQSAVRICLVRNAEMEYGATFLLERITPIMITHA
jgi:hypothetical protein